MNKSKGNSVAVAVLCLLGVASVARAQLAQSTFGTDTDGWLVANRGEVNIEFIDTRPATWRGTAEIQEALCRRPTRIQAGGTGMRPPSSSAIKARHGGSPQF